MRTDRRIDRLRTLIVAFRNFANAPNKNEPNVTGRDGTAICAVIVSNLTIINFYILCRWHISFIYFNCSLWTAVFMFFNEVCFPYLKNVACSSVLFSRQTLCLTTLVEIPANIILVKINFSSSQSVTGCINKRVASFHTSLYVTHVLTSPQNDHKDSRQMFRSYNASVWTRQKSGGYCTAGWFLGRPWVYILLEFNS